MPYNKKILGRANARLAGIRELNNAEHERRLAAVYAKLPEIERIDAELKSQMVSLTRLALSREEGSSEKLLKLRDDNLTLQMRRAEILTEAGYPAGYLEDIYDCPVCFDSGRTRSGEICSCLKRLYNAELTKELSTLLKNGSESFDNFDITLYPSSYSEKYKCIPREYMKKVLAKCLRFADSFPADRNLLLFGGPGLGKTYMSACIARAVAQNGYSVIYESAIDAFRAFEIRQFSRDQALADEAARKADAILNCDLFILDDLGTEVVTPSVQSALYTIINSRENANKRTVISTALTPSELNERYTASIFSRLEGFFDRLDFAGDDIRLKQRNKQA